jgi:membrane protease YdiL (CAAX protease family)
MWNVLFIASLFLPPVLGVVWLASASAAFVWWFLVRRAIPLRRRAVLRLRRPRGDLKVVVLAVLPLLALMWSTAVLAPPYVTMPDQSTLERLADAPLGALRLVAIAVLVAPLVEELFFRGLIQRTIERSGGAAVAIVVTSCLFALVHCAPGLLPQHFAAGLVLGYVVRATGSLWSGVLLHALYNGTAVAIAAACDALGVPAALVDPEQAPRVWQMTLGTALLAAASAGWLLDLQATARRLGRAGGGGVDGGTRRGARRPRCMITPATVDGGAAAGVPRRRARWRRAPRSRAPGPCAR